MKTKITFIIISTLVAILLISSGYALWQENLYVVGNIKIVPDPDVLASMESQLERLEEELEDEMERQRIAEEERKAAEAQALLDAQNKLEEGEATKLQLEATNKSEDNSGEIISVPPTTPIETSDEIDSEEKGTKDELVDSIVDDKEKDIKEVIETEDSNAKINEDSVESSDNKENTSEKNKIEEFNE